MSVKLKVITKSKSSLIALITPKQPKVIILFLSGIIVVSALLRLWNVGELGLGGDESVYAAQARILSGDTELSKYFVTISRGTSNFFLHQAIQSIVYAIVGFSEFSTRFLSAAFSVGTCALLFFLGRDMYGKWAGLISALLMSVNAYSIALGRAALLDSTMTFFFTLSIFMLYKWIKTGAPKWSYLLAATSAAAILTKVPSMIIIPIVIITLLFVSKRVRPINVRVFAIFALIFFAGLIPAFLQVVINFDTFVSFLGTSSSRIINVPITFYFEKLLWFSGPLFIAAVLLGILVSFVRRTKADLLCIIWLIVTGVYLQLIPVKAWNYFLPLIPVLSIFAARGITLLSGLLKPMLTNRENNEKARRKNASMSLTTISGGLIGVFLLLSVLYTEINQSAYSIVYSRPFVGLKEAAFWIKENGIPNAAVMTISQGSAQYVFSLYGHIDAYPFGSFNLHTILPGGVSMVGPPPPDPLIQNGTIDYLVHYISDSDVGDDPFHMENKSKLQSRFIELVQKYDSNTRYVYFDEYLSLNGTEIREPRVWIFEIGKRMPDLDRGVEQKGGTYFVNAKPN